MGKRGREGGGKGKGGGEGGKGKGEGEEGIGGGKEGTVGMWVGFNLCCKGKCFVVGELVGSGRQQHEGRWGRERKGRKQGLPPVLSDFLLMVQR